MKCDGCRVNGNWEHRCHGENCDCDGLMCQYQQGEITMEEVTEIINSTLQSNGKL